MADPTPGRPDSTELTDLTALADATAAEVRAYQIGRAHV